MLNAGLIRQRRRDLGLSIHEVARQLRVTDAVVKRLEEGVNHEWVTVGELTRLAEILSVDVHDMIDAPARAAGPGDDKRVEQVGRVLSEIEKLVPRSSLCKALDCTPEELEETLAQLDAALRPVGMSVHHFKASVSLEPVPEAEGSAGQLRTVIRDEIASRCLTITEANVLARAMSGTVNEWELNTYENMAFQRLRKAGLVEADAAVITTEVLESLLLSDAVGQEADQRSQA